MAGVIIIENRDNLCIDNAENGSVLNVILDQGHDHMHACGGKGRCTTCRFNVLEGGNELTPLSAFEQQCREKSAIHDHQRLACQCRLKSGKLVMSIPDQTKLPHIEYTD